VSLYNDDQPDAETLIRRVIEVINNGKSVPLSTSVLISSKDEVIDLLDNALERLPDEIKSARRLLRDRQEHLDRVQREADEIMDAARSRAERLVQRTEIVREAQRAANRMLSDAEDASLRRRHEADDYCDQKLASFEIVLERTMRTVRAGRDKLSAAAPQMDEPIDMLAERTERERGPATGYGAAARAAAEVDPAGASGGFFDQDQA